MLIDSPGPAVLSKGSVVPEEKRGPIAFLGPAAGQLREEQGIHPIELAYRLQRHPSAITRFESGDSQPRDLDHAVMVYSEVLEIVPTKIWERAFELWREDGN